MINGLPQAARQKRELTSAEALTCFILRSQLTSGPFQHERTVNTQLEPHSVHAYIARFKTITRHQSSPSSPLRRQPEHAAKTEFISRYNKNILAQHSKGNNTFKKRKKRHLIMKNLEIVTWRQFLIKRLYFKGGKKN